jgi:ABC-type dipeptide/oligopeptide/nickel transport system permease subunit
MSPPEIAMKPDLPAGGLVFPVAFGARWRDLVTRISGDRLAIAGLLLVAVFTVIAMTAPLISPQDPNAIDALRRLEGSSRQHLLGTDNLGRDLLSRLVWGSRWSLGTVCLATALIMSIGVAIGTVAGYYGGLIDAALMRVVDVLLALPSLLLALAIAGMLGPGITSVIIALVTVWWASYARIVRGLVLAMRDRDFVDAARALGARDSHIIFRHVLPNVLPSIAVLATLEMGDLILAVAGLGFLGVGVQTPIAEWGTMVNEGRSFLLTAPQLMLYPGIAISLAVIGFNLLGDGLRDVLDPRLAAPKSLR